MIHEHSAGSIIYRVKNSQTQFLIIESVFHHTWGFPKGHVESGESIQETAKREVAEEVGLKPQFDFNFSKAIEYITEERTIKRIDFFLSHFVADQELVEQEDEIANYKWVNLDEACQFLPSDRGLYEILVQACNYLKRKE